MKERKEERDSREKWNARYASLLRIDWSHKPLKLLICHSFNHDLTSAFIGPCCWWSIAPRQLRSEPWKWSGLQIPRDGCSCSFVLHAPAHLTCNSSNETREETAMWKPLGLTEISILGNIYFFIFFLAVQNMWGSADSCNNFCSLKSQSIPLSKFNLGSLVHNHISLIFLHTFAWDKWTPFCATTNPEFISQYFTPGMGNVATGILRPISHSPPFSNQ